MEKSRDTDSGKAISYERARQGPRRLRRIQARLFSLRLQSLTLDEAQRPPLSANPRPRLSTGLMQIIASLPAGWIDLTWSPT